MKNTLSNEEANEIGAEYSRLIYERHPNNSLCVDVEGLATDILGLNIIYENFAGNDKAKLGYLADGITPVCVLEGGKAKNVVYPWKTMILDRCLLNARESGRKRFTIAHETAHFILEKMTRSEVKACAHREYDRELVLRPDEFKEVFGFSEYCADKLAAAILMPKFNIEKALERFADGRKFTVYGLNIMLPEEKLRMKVMADGIGVSYQALKIRLKELGLIDFRSFEEFVSQDLQEGDFDDRDLNYDRRQGQLSPEQTYLAHRSRREAERLEQKVLKCPVCGLPMVSATAESTGYTTLKCQKCKYVNPLGLSYFRTRKQNSKEETEAFEKPVRKYKR